MGWQRGGGCDPKPDWHVGCARSSPGPAVAALGDCHDRVIAAAEIPVPDDFTRVQRRSPFLDLLGDLHVLDDDGRPVYGLRIGPEHANDRGAAHGGVLMTVADLVLGYTTAFASDPPLPLTTASMSVDFVGAAQVGEWLEGRAEIIRTGWSLVSATCYLAVGDRRVVRASSVLAVGATPLSGRLPR